MIRKRDGTKQEFDPAKVRRAILMAAAACDGDVVARINSEIECIVENVSGESVEEISDSVERVLLDYGYVDVAREFITYRLQRDRIRNMRLKPDATALGEYIHNTKYARHYGGRREVREETFWRIIEMHSSRWPGMRDRIIEAVFNPAVVSSMRCMQFAGAAIEAENARMYNCAYTLVDRPRVFGEIMYALLCGCGVGCGILQSCVEKLPALGRIDNKEVIHWTISDDIRGWATAVDTLIQAAIDGTYVEFNYSKIRAEGTPLVTSGGQAPGHLGLKRCLEGIRSVLDEAAGRKMRPIEVNDVICRIGEAVMSGGIRRAALNMIFDDGEMIYAKAPGVLEKHPWRQMSNNSMIVSTREELGRVLRVAQSGYGDPGFVRIANREYGYNPCFEIGLWPVWVNEDGSRESGFAFCNLTEINVADLDRAGFLAACEDAAFLGTLQASYTNVGYFGEATKRILERDALLGVSLTGIMDNPRVMDWMTEGASVVMQTNEAVAKEIGINPAKRTTCIKPSGTASLWFGGVGSGIHPHHARRYFRRVKDEKPIPGNEHMHIDGYNVFCIQAPDNAVCLKDVTALGQLDYALRAYRDWVLPGHRSGDATHNVSLTITASDSEMPDLIDEIWASGITSVSIVSPTIDKDFKNAPRERVENEKDEILWNYLIHNYKPVDWMTIGEAHDGTTKGLACEGTRCSI